jgi:VWFA-related protein
MRNLILFFLLGFSLPVVAADHKITVRQVQEILNAAHGQSDPEVAAKLANLQLTERVSSAKLSQWESEFPGSRTREALLTLADAAEFLDLPSTDIPGTAPPDNPTQRLMLSQAINYVSRTIQKLPNFTAIRTTIHFEDTQAQQSNAQSPLVSSSSVIRSGGAGAVANPTSYDPLRLTERSSRTVNYRDGLEVTDSLERGDLHQPVTGLTTSGEFGPILSVVFADAIRSSIHWSHWEQGSAGLKAVFEYSVPIGKSHYMVEFPSATGTERRFPAYHGEITLDQSDGTVLRLTVVSQLAPPLQSVETEILVEYGTVVIGERNYICPVRGVALSRTPIVGGNPNMPLAARPLQTQLNDISFIQYHLFRASAHIVTADKAPAGDNIRDARANSAASPEDAPTALPADPAPLPSDTASTKASQESPVSSATPGPSLQTPTEPTVVPAVSTASVASQKDDAPVVLHTSAKVVMEDVTVSDRNRPVHGIDRNRFHIFEDGTEQNLSSFDEHQPAAPIAEAHPAMLPGLWTNVPDRAQADALDVVLLDELNTPVSIQQQVRSDLLHHLQAISFAAPIAVFTLSSRLHLIQGFTTDTAQIATALKSSKVAPRPSSLDKPSADALIKTLADLGGNAAKLAATQQQTEERISVVDSGNRAQATLAALQQLARYLSAVPGRKNLIWFSMFFPFDLDAQTSQLLAQARVAVYPVDARGLCGPKVFSATSGCQDSFDVQEKYSSMEQKIAEETGGHAYRNTNAPGAVLGEVAENDSSYYSLGYTPHPQRPVPGLRKVDIHLDRAAYQLAYRHVYFDPGNSGGVSEAINSIQSALLLGVPPSTQILFEARLELDHTISETPGGNPPHATVEDRNVHRYRLDLSIDPHNLTFDQAPDGNRKIDLRCAVMAYDGNGKSVNYATDGIRLNVPAEQYARLMTAETATSVPLRLKLDLPIGMVTLRTVVYDAATLQTGSLEIPLTIKGH